MVKTNKVKRNKNVFSQSIEGGDFIDDYKTWKDHCLSIDDSQLMLKNSTTLYDFLFNHVFNNIRIGSKNAGSDGKGAREALEVIEGLLEDERGITGAHITVINAMAEVVFELKDTTLDPKDILFTEYEKTGADEKLRPVEVRGHYRTENYTKKHGGEAVPSEWLSGKNPPHMALFSKESSEFAKPKGLYWILKEAKEDVGPKGEKTTITYAEVYNLVAGKNDAKFLEQFAALEKFMDKVVNDNKFWNAGGRLLVTKLRKEIQAQEFKLNLGDKEQTAARALTGAGAAGKGSSLVGKIERFKIKRATSLPILSLIDNALKRKGTNKAPNGYRAWQGERKTGFDYRKTAKEKFGEDTGKYRPDAKIISKMWQALLWRS